MATERFSPEGGTEQPPQSLEGLVDLAQTISARAGVEEQQQRADTEEEARRRQEEQTRVEQERQQRMEAVAEKALQEREKDAFDTGRFSYYQMIGDWQRLDQERAPGMLDPRYTRGSKYVWMGVYQSSSQLGRTAASPEDWLEAFDKTEVWANDRITESPPPMDIDEFYRAKADYVVVHTPPPVSRREYTPGEAFSVSDFPKETAWKLYSQRILGPGTEHPYWESYKASIRKSLEGFSKTALGAADIEVALEGYRRLGLLNDPELIKKTHEEMTRLSTSANPEDRHRAQRVSRKVLELRTVHGSGL